MVKRSERTLIEADSVLKELALIGFSSLRDYHRITGNGLPSLDLSDVSDDKWRAIKKVKTKEYKDGRGEEAQTVLETEIEMHDKRAALVDLGKHLGLFKPDTAVSVELAAKAQLVADENLRIERMSEIAKRFLPAPPKEAAKAKKAKETAA